jgi:hypothetical protein
MFFRTRELHNFLSKIVIVIIREWIKGITWNNGFDKRKKRIMLLDECCGEKVDSVDSIHSY